MINVPVSTTLEVTTQVVKTIDIVSVRVDYLMLDFNSTSSILKISCLDVDGNVVKNRYFAVSGATYGSLIGIPVNGILAELVISGVSNFAMSLISTPSLIDGIDVVELKSAEITASI